MKNNYQPWESLLKTSEVLNRLLQQRDGYTGLHSRKVAILSSRIAQFLGSDIDTQKAFTVIGELHDIGKLTWPDFMFTPTKKIKTPSIQHWIQDHPITAFKILESTLSDSNNHEWLIVVLCHHWNYAGKAGSYPEDALQIIRGHLRHLPDFDETKTVEALYHTKTSLNGMDPNTLRLKIGIIRAADSLDAATAARPHKEHKSYSEIITELTNSDIHHPDVVEVLKSHELKTFFDSVQRVKE